MASYQHDAPWRVTERAQALLKVKPDGVWGEQTQAAYIGADASVKAEIDRELAREQLSVFSVARVTTQVSRPAQPKRTAMTQVQKPTAVAAAVYSGWKGRLSEKATKAGIAVGSIGALINQVQKETGGRLTIAEQMASYSNEWLRGKMRTFRGYTNAALDSLRSQGEVVFFNAMYGDRKDLGNRGIASGDGYLYRGRGALQLTGRYNYQKVGELLGVNLLADPDWVTRTEDNAVASAIGFLRLQGKLNVALSTSDMSRLVNPGLA